jgi:hypothetical protein
MQIYAWRLDIRQNVFDVVVYSPWVNISGNSEDLVDHGRI